MYTHRNSSLVRGRNGRRGNVLGVAFIDPQPRELGGLHHQPAHVAPHKATAWTVRVGRLIRMLMMQAMDRYPTGRRVLDAAYAQDDEGPLQPFGANQPTVGEQAMIAEIDAKGAEDKPIRRAPGPSPPSPPGSRRGGATDREKRGCSPIAVDLTPPDIAGWSGS
jgi:hypothetical protein